MAMVKHIGTDRAQTEEFQSMQPHTSRRMTANILRPDHFIVVNKMTAGSVIENLHIQNWPTHLFSISSCSDLTMRNMLLDNSAGDAPNAISGGLPAAHNSDGFDVSTTNNSLIYDNTVYNQDDCVAITSGNNITVDNMYCSGGHGLSIGSVGGKSNNNVTNIVVSA
jgi:polygalacturonase